jgi:hypothetical protein
MLSLHPTTPKGINPGAAFRLYASLGMCGQHGGADGEGGAAKGRDLPHVPFDPQSCDHRHHFRRWGSVRNDCGFDNGSIRRSQWQLVPLGGSRDVELLWDRLFPKQVFSEDPSMASVHRQGDRFVITGLKAGRTGLHAANGRGTCWSELEITVRAARQIPVVFHYMKDQRHQTNRAPGSGGKLLTRVNEIIAPQTCISFGERGMTSPKFEIDADLGDFVDPRGSDVKHWCSERIQQLQTFGCINVFFVWRIAGVGADATGGQMLDNGMCFLGDVTKKDAGRALAHEFGHYLTRFDRESLYHDGEGHTADPECLMDPLASGTRISRDEVDVMYETAADSGAP